MSEEEMGKARQFGKWLADHDTVLLREAAERACACVYSEEFAELGYSEAVQGSAMLRAAIMAEPQAVDADWTEMAEPEEGKS